jgi:hypothetical protein
MPISILATSMRIDSSSGINNCQVVVSCRCIDFSAPAVQCARRQHEYIWQITAHNRDVAVPVAQSRQRGMPEPVQDQTGTESMDVCFHLGKYAVRMRFDIAE